MNNDLDDLESAFEDNDDIGSESTEISTNTDGNVAETFSYEIKYLEKHLNEMDSLYADMRELTNEITKHAKKGGKNLSFIHQNTANLVALKSASLQGLKALVDTKQKAFNNHVKLNPVNTSDDSNNIPPELLALLIEKSRDADSGHYIDASFSDISEEEIDSMFEARMEELGGSDIDEGEHEKKVTVTEIISDNSTIMEEVQDNITSQSAGEIEPEIVFGSDSNWYVIDEKNCILNGYELPADKDPEIEEIDGEFVAVDNEGYEYRVLDLSLLSRP